MLAGLVDTWDYLQDNVNNKHMDNKNNQGGGAGVNSDQKKRDQENRDNSKATHENTGNKENRPSAENESDTM